MVGPLHVYIVYRKAILFIMAICLHCIVCLQIAIKCVIGCAAAYGQRA